MSKVPWILGVIVVLALAVSALVVALVSGSGQASIPGGSSTATIRVTDSPSGQASFSGTVGGKALTGAVITSSPLSTTVPGTGTFSLNGPLFTYRGELGGTPYVLHVSLGTLGGANQVQSEQVTFDVTGSYGSKKVTATAGFSLSSLSSGGQPQTVTFNGHVGTQLLTGTATATQVQGGFVIDGTLNAVPTP